MQTAAPTTAGNVEGHQSKFGDKSMKFPDKEEVKTEEDSGEDMSEIRKAIRREIRKSLMKEIGMAPPVGDAAQMQGRPQPQSQSSFKFGLGELRNVFGKLESNDYTVEDLYAAASYAKDISEFIGDEMNAETVGGQYDSGTVQRNSKNLAALATELKKLADGHSQVRQTAMALVDEIGMLGWRYRQAQAQQSQMGANNNVSNIPQG